MKPEELTIEQTLTQMREVIDALNDADGKTEALKDCETILAFLQRL